MTRDPSPGSALIVALFMLALASAGAAMLAELGRRTVVRTRLDRDGVRVWFLAEAGLADTIATLPVGTDFTDRVSGSSAPVPPDWQYAAEIRDDVDESPNDPTRDANRRVIVRITARGTGVVRRRLEAVVGRAPEPFFPGAVTLAGGVRELAGDFLLDGRDAAMGTGCTMSGTGQARAGLSLADAAALPVVTHPEWITGTGIAPSISAGAIPDLTSLAQAQGGAHRSAGPVGGALGSIAVPELTIVDGDAVVDGSVTGAGLLYVTGRLRIDGALAFTGVVAAGGGVDVTATGSLAVCGGLWAAGTDALDLHGSTSVRASAEAIRRASDLASLPARARVIAVRELF
jgi:hypothetical protein